MKQRYRIQVWGVVQDIGLRYRVSKKAGKLDLVGWVHNNGDGSVSLEIEGRQENLQKFSAWLKASPGFSRIDKLKSDEINILNEANFIVK